MLSRDRLSIISLLLVLKPRLGIDFETQYLISFRFKNHAKELNDSKALFKSF